MSNFKKIASLFLILVLVCMSVSIVMADDDKNEIIRNMIGKEIQRLHESGHQCTYDCIHEIDLSAIYSSDYIPNVADIEKNEIIRNMIGKEIQQLHESGHQCTYDCIHEIDLSAIYSSDYNIINKSQSTVQSQCFHPSLQLISATWYPNSSGGYPRCANDMYGNYICSSRCGYTATLYMGIYYAHSWNGVSNPIVCQFCNTTIVEVR